jgi:hypothetical protein
VEEQSGRGERSLRLAGNEEGQCLELVGEAEVWLAGKHKEATGGYGCQANWGWVDLLEAVHVPVLAPIMLLGRVLHLGDYKIG